MHAISPLLVALVLAWPNGVSPDDTARLREMLQDRQQPRAQSQAALVLVQDPSPEAEAIVRHGLRQTDSPDVFLALTSAVRLCQDRRFEAEHLEALACVRLAIRQAAADTLAALADVDTVVSLRRVARDERAATAARLAALSALGRSGRKDAVPVLIRCLSLDGPLRPAAAEGLAELTGQTLGSEESRWREWWKRHEGLSNERWLELRLSYQGQRARRLEGDLERARGQVALLHQQLHARLPAAERLNHLMTLVDQDDPAVRLLAIGWATELLPAIDSLGQRAVVELLLRLSRDGAADVQRAAVLSLGRVPDVRVLERLGTLLEQGAPPIRAAAARSLAQQARGNGAEALARQKQVVPMLQKALEDPALEVVVEAAEDLGTLGVPEAGPVLVGLLCHSSEAVRLTAAQALERSADVAVLGSLIDALEEPSAGVRFSLVGAIGRSASGRGLSERQRGRLHTRLEQVLLRDADAGVRSRAATVLGECGTPAVLPALWQRARSAEDPRVQEKAWAAMVDIVARSGNLELVQEWDRTLADSKQNVRRLHLLTEVSARWPKREDARSERALAAAQELLVQVQIDQGKWEAAFPLVRELLNRTKDDDEIERRLHWLLTVGEMAFRDGRRADALRAAQEAQAFLSRHKILGAEFERLARQARQGD
jgi:HEAT repeat protein